MTDWLEELLKGQWGDVEQEEESILFSAGAWHHHPGARDRRQEEPPQGQGQPPQGQGQPPQGQGQPPQGQEPTPQGQGQPPQGQGQPPQGQDPTPQGQGQPLEGQWKDMEQAGQAVPVFPGAGEQEGENGGLSQSYRMPWKMGQSNQMGPGEATQSLAIPVAESRWGNVLGALFSWGESVPAGETDWGVATELPVRAALVGELESREEERAILRLDSDQGRTWAPDGETASVGMVQGTGEIALAQWERRSALEEGLRQLGRSAAYATRPAGTPVEGRTVPSLGAAHWQGNGDLTAHAVDRVFERDARRYNGKFLFF